MSDKATRPTTFDFTSKTSVTLATTTTASATTTSTRPPTPVQPYFDERGWRELPPNELTSRAGSALVFAGDRLVVWGGISRTAPQDRSDGASYLAGRWTSMAENSSIDGVGPVAVWTGRELFVYLGASAAWHPGNNVWRDLASPHTGEAGDGHPLAAVWTGNEVLIVGYRTHPLLALEDNLFVSSYSTDLVCCATYPDPPFSLTYGDAFWTGEEMLLIGALLEPGGTPIDGEGRSHFGSLDPVSGSWTVHDPPPLTNGIPIVSTWTGSALFVIGSDGSAARWTPSDGWARIPQVPLPTGLHCAQRLASVDSRAIVLVCDQAAVWEEVAGRWYTIASPESASWHSNVCELLPGLGGRPEVFVVCTSYIVGNQFIRIDLSAVEATSYSDPATRSQWEVLPNPAATRLESTTMVWNGTELLYFPGHGIEVEEFGGWRYDPATNIMHRIPTAPYPGRGGQVALWSGSELLVLSGPMMVWDPETLAWRTTNQPPGFSPVPYGAWAGAEMIFYGSAWEPQDAGAAYDPVADTWRPIAPGPEAIAAGIQVMATSGDKVYVFGNYSHDTQSQSGAVYDPKTDTWRTLPPIPVELLLEGSVGDFVGGEFIVVGSNRLERLSDDASLTVGLAYSPQRDAWRTITNIRQPIRHGNWLAESISAVEHDGELAVLLPEPFHGETSSIAFYDPLADPWRYVDGAPATRWGTSLVSGNTFLAYLTSAGTVLLHDEWRSPCRLCSS